jgi:spore maturation protein CgeB
MRILGLWVVDYFSGSTSDFFEKAFRNIGHELDIVPITFYGCEANLAKALKEKKYDILFHVPYRGVPRPEFIRNITNNTNTITVAWNCDDEWLWYQNDKNGTPAIANDYDYCITSRDDFIEKYEAIGQRNVILGQWGYSEDWRPKKFKKDIDVYFCGQRNEVRDTYFRELKRLGINVTVEGPGYSQNGKIDFQDMINRYRRAKIALNFVTGTRNEFIYQQVKCRNFEVPAVGTFLLTEWCDALDKFFEIGEEVEGFKSVSEAAKKIRYYLEREGDRERIAKDGHHRNKEYSFENILKVVLGHVK